MSIVDQSTSPDVDYDFDIEEELSNDDLSHAIPFCVDHRGAAFFPVAGTIVEAICGRLLRIRNHVVRPPKHKKCSKCSDFQGKTFNCYYCGREVFG